MIWYDAKALVASGSVEGKVYLYALYGFKFVQVTFAKLNLLKQLYLFDEELPIFSVDRETMIHAFRFYHDASKEDYPFGVRCVKKIDEDAKKDGGIALLYGVALLAHPDRQISNNSLLYFLTGADLENGQSAQKAAELIRDRKLTSTKKVRELFEIAFDKGVLDKKYWDELAKMCRDGEEGELDSNRAKALYLKLAGDGDDKGTSDKRVLLLLRAFAR